MFLERQAFAKGAFESDYLREEFCDSSHVVVLLIGPDGPKVRGFTYAVPVIAIEPYRAPKASDTAYIADTVLDSELRGHGLVGVMMSCLEVELKRRGFKFLERHAAVAHGYAGKISKHYRLRIEVQRRPSLSEWGSQVFFRIRL
jgi:hypothetical protein